MSLKGTYIMDNTTQNINTTNTETNNQKPHLDFIPQAKRINMLNLIRQMIILAACACILFVPMFKYSYAPERVSDAAYLALKSGIDEETGKAIIASMDPQTKSDLVGTREIWEEASIIDAATINFIFDTEPEGKKSFSLWDDIKITFDQFFYEDEADKEAGEVENENEEALNTAEGVGDVMAFMFLAILVLTLASMMITSAASLIGSLFFIISPKVCAEYNFSLAHDFTSGRLKIPFLVKHCVIPIIIFVLLEAYCLKGVEVSALESLREMGSGFFRYFFYFTNINWLLLLIPIISIIPSVMLDNRVSQVRYYIARNSIDPVLAAKISKKTNKIRKGK